MRYGQISCEAIESERHTADVLAMVVDTSCRIAGLHLLSYNIKPGTHQHLPTGGHTFYCIVRYYDYLMRSIYAGREWVQFCLVDESMVQYTTAIVYNPVWWVFVYLKALLAAGSGLWMPKKHPGTTTRPNFTSNTNYRKLFLPHQEAVLLKEGAVCACYEDINPQLK